MTRVGESFEAGDQFQAIKGLQVAHCFLEEDNVSKLGQCAKGSANPTTTGHISVLRHRKSPDVEGNDAGSGNTLIPLVACRVKTLVGREFSIGVLSCRGPAIVRSGEVRADVSRRGGPTRAVSIRPFWFYSEVKVGWRPCTRCQITRGHSAMVLAPRGMIWMATGKAG